MEGDRLTAPRRSPTPPSPAVPERDLRDRRLTGPLRRSGERVAGEGRAAAAAAVLLLCLREAEVDCPSFFGRGRFRYLCRLDAAAFFFCLA